MNNMSIEDNMIINFDDLKNSKYKYDRQVYYSLLDTEEKQKRFKETYGELMTMCFHRINEIKLPDHIYSDLFFDLETGKPTRFCFGISLELDGANFVNVIVNTYVDGETSRDNRQILNSNNILLKRKDFATAFLSCILTNISIDMHPIIKEKINNTICNNDLATKIVPYNISSNKLRFVIINDTDNEIVEVANQFTIKRINNDDIIIFSGSHGIVESSKDVLYLGIFNNTDLLYVYDVSLKSYCLDKTHSFQIKTKNCDKKINDVFKTEITSMLKDTGDKFINYFNDEEKRVNTFIDSLFW